MIIAQNPFKMGYIVGLWQFPTGTSFGPAGVQTGDALQTRVTEGFAPANTASVIPVDGTIPQNTEGAAYAIDTSIAPRRASSSLLVRVFIPIVSCSGAGNFVGALFRDAGVDAIAANAITVGVVNQQYAFELLVRVLAGSIDLTTFKFRYGPATAITAYILSSGTSGGYFGGLPTGYMTVTEIAA